MSTEKSEYYYDYTRNDMNKPNPFAGPYPDEMFEEAERREKENKVLDIAKNIMEENKAAFQHLAAIERKEFAERGFEELTTNEKIQLALEEIDWIVIGGQDGQEFYGSIQFLRKVLRSLVTPEQPTQGHTKTDLDAL
jgi:hypothetical protein